MKGSGLIFLVFIIGFAVLIFLVSTGVFEKIGIQKVDFSLYKDLKNSRSSSTSNDLAKTTSSKNVPRVNVSKPSSKVTAPQATSTINPKDIPAGFTIDKISPYFRKVRLSSLSAGSSRSYGRVMLGTNLKAGETINVTGWLIKGKNGGQFIPQAVEVYEPSGLTPPGDIVLKNGHILNIYSSKSTIGQNLRLNKCTGYLESLFDFIPPLPRNCPRTYQDRSELYEFGGQCENYVRSLGTCRIPETNFLWLTGDSKCRDFLDKVNYRGCFDKHRQDGDFLSREWRAWTGSRFLDERHDKVLLLDKQGLLVDLREY